MKTERENYIGPAVIIQQFIADVNMPRMRDVEVRAQLREEEEPKNLLFGLLSRRSDENLFRLLEERLIVPRANKRNTDITHANTITHTRPSITHTHTLVEETSLVNECC